MRLQATRLGVTSAGRSAMSLDRQIAALFAQGEQGAWYDIAPQYCFQDTAGTTPAAIGDPVGLVLDRSKGLGISENLRQTGVAMLVGTAQAASFNTETGDGSVTRGGGANDQSFVQFSGLDNAAFYVVKLAGITGTVVIRSGSQSGLIVGSQAGGGVEIVLNPSSGLISITASSGTVTFTVVAIRELPGNHAYQTTATSRPILSRHPVTGIRNLLIYSEQFDNAAWIKGRSTITANALIAPDGTLSGYLLSDTTDSGSHVLQANQSKPASAVQYTLSFYAKAGSFPRSRILMAGFSFNDHAAATIDLENGQVDIPATVAGNFSNASVSVQDVGEGWYRIALTATSDTTSVIRYDLRIDNGTTDSYVGSGGGNIGAWGAQLDVGPVATPYQKVMSAADVTETGVASVHYLRFDGADDFLVTNSIDFTATDKMTVWAGVRKLSDAARAMFVELGTAGVQGRFYVEAPSTPAAQDLYFVSFGSLARQVSAVSPAPSTVVLVGVGDISGDFAALRVNGQQGAPNVDDQGTGNYSNHPLYIGRRAGNSLAFNGHLYGLIIRGAASNDSQIKVVERYLAQKTGVTLA